jgi:predicted histone-like DNA-binding protein
VKLELRTRISKVLKSSRPLTDELQSFDSGVEDEKCTVLQNAVHVPYSIYHACGQNENNLTNISAWQLFLLLEWQSRKRRRAMSIPYRLFKRKDLNDPEKPEKWYGFVKSRGRYPLHKLAERISNETTISTADVYAVLKALVDIIPKILGDGFVVVLGELGIMRTSIGTVGAESKNDFTEANIIRRKIVFTPGTLLTDAVKLFAFKKVK